MSNFIFIIPSNWLMKKFALLPLLLFLFQCMYAQHTCLIKNVSVIDVEKGTTLKNVNVLLRDSVIAQVTMGQPVISADTIIDGSNLFLMPGLWDMHTHVWNDELFFPLLIANGVTGIRGMFENINVVKTWKKKIAEGKITGPELKVAGPIVDGPQPIWPGSVAVKDAEQGRHAVDSLNHILHTDFIKVYSLLSRESYFAIADESKKENIPFAGHVPNVVTVLEAAKAGQKSQEHLYGFIEAASDSADYYLQFLQEKITDTTLKDRVQKKLFLLRTYNPKKLKALLRQMKQYDSWICPTLTVNHSIAYLNDTTLLNDPRMQYMGNYMRNSWNPSKDFRFKTWTTQVFDLYRKEFELKLTIVKAMQDAGIPMLAGTDFPNPHCYPGFSLHDELQWMVKAGLSPAQALKTATINPAKYFDISDKFGTIAKGKIANLVLLDANPLTDISNTKKINAVIMRGKVFNQKDLQAMLAKVKKTVGN